MNDLLTTDLHLTSSPRDSYRWSVFDHLRKTAKKLNVDRIWLLGDLTENKDNHSSLLVNLICAQLHELARLSEVHIVRGNHDGIDPAWPFFKFLRLLDNVHFYSEPTDAGRGTLVLPHSRQPEKDWASPIGIEAKVIMAHATFSGAVGENGAELLGCAVPKWARNKRIYSGDVHTPQKVGNVTYVGSPHHVHFGDKFEPRMLHLHEKGETSIPLGGIKRLMLDIDSAADLAGLGSIVSGDQAKIRLHLDDARIGQWQQERREVYERCTALGLDVAAVELVREKTARPLLRTQKTASPVQVLEEWLARSDAPDEATAEIGRSILNSVR